MVAAFRLALLGFGVSDLAVGVGVSGSGFVRRGRFKVDDWGGVGAGGGGAASHGSSTVLSDSEPDSCAAFFVACVALAMKSLSTLRLSEDWGGAFGACTRSSDTRRCSVSENVAQNSRMTERMPPLSRAADSRVSRSLRLTDAKTKESWTALASELYAKFQVRFGTVIRGAL